MNSTYQKHIYPSGLTLLTVPMPATKSFTALVMLGVGSRYEDKHNNGLSHFLEHMVFKGTTKYPDAQTLAAAVDSRGAEFNAFTGKEYTGFYIKAASTHLDFSLEMLSQLIYHPLLPAAELERERGVIIEEINMYEDQPMSKISHLYDGLLYGDTSLGWPIIGQKANILNFQKKDFTQYMASWYQPANMVIALAGALPKAGVKKLVASYFSQHSGQAKPKIGLVQGMKTSFSQTGPQLHVHHKKTEQAHLCLGIRTFPRGSQARYALSLITIILGGNMSSRLFTEVREKRGLAYYIHTVNQYFVDTGYLVTQAGTDTKKAFLTVELIRNEYQKLTQKQNGLTAKELVKAKDYLKGKLVLNLEDSREVAELYVEDQLLEGQTRTPAQIIKSVDLVTLDEVKQLASRLFQPANLNLAVIGPYEDKDKQRFRQILQS
jgi:predicted Zn-dependent peptidase